MSVLPSALQFSHLMLFSITHALCPINSSISPDYFLNTLKPLPQSWHPLRHIWNWPAVATFSLRVRSMKWNPSKKNKTSLNWRNTVLRIYGFNSLNPPFLFFWISRTGMTYPRYNIKNNYNTEIYWFMDWIHDLNTRIFCIITYITHHTVNVTTKT